MTWWRKEHEDRLSDVARERYEVERLAHEKHWDELTDVQRDAWRTFTEETRPAI